MPRPYQRAIITGATSGIGAAFAVELPKSTDLLLTGRDGEQLARARERLAAPGRMIETVVADLTNPADLDRLAETASAFEADLLINNAGAGQLGAFLDNAEDKERATVLVNVVAVVTLTRRLLPDMLARARSRHRPAGLIILSSLAALSPVPMFATYAASKAFGLYFAEALADELKHEPIDVLAVCPGATDTAFGKRAGYQRGNFPGASDPREVARRRVGGDRPRDRPYSGLPQSSGVRPLDHAPPSGRRRRRHGDAVVRTATAMNGWPGDSADRMIRLTAPFRFIVLLARARRVRVAR